MDKCCLEHSGHASRIKNSEDDIIDVKHSATAAHRRIDGMKNWVIAGMSSLVIQLIVAVIGLTLYWVRSRPGL